MTPTQGNSNGQRKQPDIPDSCAETKRRQNTIQSDLVAIAYAMGSSRPALQRSGPWYEACRNPKEYEPSRPYLREDDMIVDAVRTVAARGTYLEQQAVRKAVCQYFETRCRLALEFLGEEAEGDPVALCLETNKEITEAQNAIITAVNLGTPEAFERAARETGEADVLMDVLETSLYETARRTSTNKKLSLTR